METQVLEGTVAEIRRKIGELQVAPDDRLRVVVSRAQEAGAASGERRFEPTEFRNGVPLLPRRHLEQPVDLKLVQSLMDAEDIETLRADRTPRR